MRLLDLHSQEYLKLMLVMPVQLLDTFFSPVLRSYTQEKSTLSILLFHGVFPEEKKGELKYVDPEQMISVTSLRGFLENCLQKKFTFISPEALLQGLPPGKKYILVTFDDGYFNNYYAREILKEYDLPGVIFISTRYTLENRCFWWDVLYRQMRQKGLQSKKIYREIERLKTKKIPQIEQELEKNFGKSAFCPKADIDRPFTPRELKSFACQKGVFLGNHTSNHEILTNCTEEEARGQILGCQKELKQFTENPLPIISYPNGAYSEKIARIAQESNISVGITVEPRENSLPLGLHLTLGRFLINKGNISTLPSERAIYNYLRNQLLGIKC